MEKITSLSSWCYFGLSAIFSSLWHKGANTKLALKSDREITTLSQIATWGKRNILPICHKEESKTLVSGINTECVTKIIFSHFSTKTYVVGTQKNRLNEMVLLSTQNIC